MKQLLTIILLSIICTSCDLVLESNSPKISEINESEYGETVSYTNNICTGTYLGPEFIGGSDVGHQFSNKMCHEVGKILKDLYDKGDYSKVDFSNITMSTIGMGSGTVTYIVSIPIVSVESKCDAYTSFDHVGGWNHTPSLASRKQELSDALINGDSLDVSALKTTPEGLQEYWIQWRNKHKQSSCL